MAEASRLLVAALPNNVLNKNTPSPQAVSENSRLCGKNSALKTSQPMLAILPGEILYRNICDIDHIINKSTTFEKSKYKIINKLGSGGCGQVFLASNSNNTKKFAVKTSIVQRAQLVHCFLSEVKILTAAKHPNIIEMVDVFVGEAPQTYHVVLELMHVTCGDLFELKGRNSAMQCSVMVVVMKQVLVALEYLHNEVNVIHRDVKGDNILLLRNGIVKLADFGMSAFCPDVIGKNIVQGFKKYCGTEAFMAPELLERKEYGTAIDIYATGRVFGHLMGQVHPRGQCQHRAHDIIKHMLNHNPIYRPTASQALEHAAFVNASSRIPVATYLFRNFPAVQK
ncbi:kinase-like domain-containing protein [Obelidium mucronatum]|nr:kinase-like domain-containing protein [Obelidium mucronatum]